MKLRVSLLNGRSSQAAILELTELQIMRLLSLAAHGHDGFFPEPGTTLLVQATCEKSTPGRTLSDLIQVPHLEEVGLEP